MTTTLRHSAALGLALAFAACGRAPDTDRPAGTDSTAEAVAPTDSAGGMAGMPGMKGMAGMPADPMTDAMQKHMEAMMAAGPDSQKAMAPMHRQMTANLLSTLAREMREMNMPADPAWTATLDSVRKDLVRLPELSGEELGKFLPAHRDRVVRLKEMHQAMMAKMK